MSRDLLVLVNDLLPKDDSTMVNIFVREQAEALQQYFENIYIIVPYPWGLEYKRRTRYENYQRGKVRIYFLKYINPVFPITFYRFRAVWVYLETRAVSNFIKKNNLKFDLIHAHYIWPTGAVAANLKEEFNVPLVITEHTHKTLYPLIKRRDKILAHVCNSANAIIRPNKRDIALFSSIVSSNKIFHIVNGYNTGEIRCIPQEAAREKLGLPPTKFLLFNLAQLRAEKGQKYLIQAMREVAIARDDVLCFIGGDGSLRRKLQAEIDRLNLGTHVKLLGHIRHSEVMYWYNACDIFALPSLSECLPVVHLEAMACGKPVVATYNGGSEEIITSGEYGLLCQPADPKELAEKILLALNKKWDREKILNYGRRFTWRNNAEETLRLYESVLKKPQESAA
jgi:teichuronic acid biosynthesis glycosyltransferase TuaC